MRKEIADLVFPVFRKAIEIKEGLRVNEHEWQFADSQKTLLALLQVPVPDNLRAEMLGEHRHDAPIGGQRLSDFLGIRYALACWLDEVFIGDSVWRVQWNEDHIETALYAINERASKFWEQAQRAQSRPTRDALEVYYLCVMLGFRGELADRPGEVTAWREAVEAQITQGEEREYSPPPALKITPNVRLLRGERLMQKWFMILTIVALLYIPLLFLLFS